MAWISRLYIYIYFSFHRFLPQVKGLTTTLNGLKLKRLDRWNFFFFILCQLHGMHLKDLILDRYSTFSVVNWLTTLKLSSGAEPCFSHGLTLITCQAYVYLVTRFLLCFCLNYQPALPYPRLLPSSSFLI